MFLPTILSIVPLLLFSISALDFHQWAPPGPDDVRSPCPALNSMANHGFLPHSGKDLTVNMLTGAMEKVFNIGLDLRTILAIGGLFSSPNALLNGTMDLNDLNKHNYIEHDGSLSRAPIHEGGDDHTFRQDIFDQVLMFFSNATKATITIDMASKAHLHRVQTDSQTMAFSYGSKQNFLALGETALYLTAMGDPLTGATPLDYVRVLFEQERLPYNEGWRTPTIQISLGVILETVRKLAAADGKMEQQGTIKALVGLDALTNDIPAFIQNLSDRFGLGGLLEESKG